MDPAASAASPAVLVDDRTRAEWPRIDVVIAARNEERFIAKCLAAVREQAYDADRVTVFVVDSNSTDNTARAAADAGAVVLRETKPGAAAARNCGIRSGRGELVALLDAHCIPERHWIQRMVDRFGDWRLGGCQGLIENRAVDPHVDRYLSATGALANERVLEDTVTGKRNLYPWILSGNSMYRRRAIEEAGLFDERLMACEDVDLAWRVFLSGYQLGYEPGARAVHYDLSTWPVFVRKGRHYGAAAATLADAYRAHGARNKFAPPRVLNRSLERTLVVGQYWLGYNTQRLKLRLRLAAPLDPQTPHAVRDEFRPRIVWTRDLVLRIDPCALFWLRDDEAASVIVSPGNRTRIVLDGVGDVIWRALVDGAPRDVVVGRISASYNVAEATAAADLDEFVDELIESGVLRQERTA